MSIKAYQKPAYPGDRIMWVPEISERANVKPQTIYKWFSNGVLPFARVGGRRGAWESDFLAAVQPNNTAA